MTNQDSVNKIKDFIKSNKIELDPEDAIKIAVSEEVIEIEVLESSLDSGSTFHEWLSAPKGDKKLILSPINSIVYRRS